MINSMTGYGGAKGEVDAIAVSAELKSVNNRYLDVSVRLPKSCLFAEEAVRAAVGVHISRGKVDVFITVDTSATQEVSIQVNQPLAAAYVKAVEGLAAQYGLPSELSALSLSRFPEVLTADKSDADQDSVSKAIVSVLSQALEGFDAMRAREGAKLREDLSQKLDRLEEMTAAVERRSPETVKEYREKLLTRMQEVLADTAVDEARILQEAAIYADKVAVDEETVRLRSHIAQFRLLLEGGSPVGRKLDFLIQEMNREVNTTGSKCVDSTIAKTVIDMKAELEKMREQIQNIE
ncbi:MAG: YicC family protein [Oscillospiraceae bacterium]|nr:YicC family protein [Oscillospiraceae bacterium]